MFSRVTTLFTVLMAIAVFGQPQSQSQPEPAYGDVRVSNVLRLDERVRIYCDIPELPPIIGRDIPVCINGLTPSNNAKDNLALLMFLDELFLSGKELPESIVLKDIRRGSEFCLIADIEVDGQDLCDLLIANKLAEKIIRIPSGTPDASVSPSGSVPAATVSAATAADIENAQLVASRSSKVYHWATCPHARRMDPSKWVVFSNRSEAEATGRRPCKTCTP